MSQEALSALLDGECTAAELDRLLEQMERDPQLKTSYSRLCQAREAAEGTRILKDQPCICADVMAQVKDEPMAEAGRKVTDLDSRRRWYVANPLAGMAAAAAVAAVAVLVTVPSLRSGGQTPSASFMPQASVPGMVQPVSLPLGSHARGERVVVLTQEELNELNDQLLEHSSSLADQGMGGTLRYARVAAARPMPAVYRPEENSGDNR